MHNRNLFSALRAAFPADLDAIAVETDDGLAYSWTGSPRADVTGKLTGVAALGQNLVDDHPIGIAYCGGGPNAASPTALCNDRDFVAPSNGTVNGTQVFWVNTTGGNANREKTDMILYNRTFTTAVNGGSAGAGPSVECASCHDPHVAQGDTAAASGQPSPTATR